MPNLTVYLDLPKETYERVLALPPQGRRAFDAALQSVAMAVAAAVPGGDPNGVPLFPRRDLAAPITLEDLQSLQERLTDDEDSEIIHASGLAGR